MIKFIIDHVPVSAKNEYGFSKRTGKMFLRKEIKEYYKSAKKQLKKQLEQYPNFNFPILEDINMCALFYPKSWRNDYLNLLSAPGDALQKAGIIKNDRQIKSSNGSHIAGINKDKPYTEVFIEPT